MSKSQVEIVQNAQRLAADLQAGPAVSKNAFLSVVATFLSDPVGDLPRLRRTMELLEQGNGGHLKRGGGFGAQVRVVIREVGRLLKRGEWKPDELKSLFGWTARLLLVRQETRGQTGLQQDRKDAPTHQRPREERKRPAQPGPSLGELGGGKNRSVLEQMRAKLAGSEKKEPQGK